VPAQGGYCRQQPELRPLRKVPARPKKGPEEPGKGKEEVRNTAKEKQGERRGGPGEVAELVGGVRHPVKADQREDELGDPSSEEDPFP